MYFRNWSKNYPTKWDLKSVGKYYCLRVSKGFTVNSRWEEGFIRISILLSFLPSTVPFCVVDTTTKNQITYRTLIFSMSTIQYCRYSFNLFKCSLFVCWGNFSPISCACLWKVLFCMYTRCSCTFLFDL